MTAGMHTLTTIVFKSAEIESMLQLITPFVDVIGLDVVTIGKAPVMPFVKMGKPALV